MNIMISEPMLSAMAVARGPASFKNLFPGRTKQPQPIIAPNANDQTSNSLRSLFSLSMDLSSMNSLYKPID